MNDTSEVDSAEEIVHRQKLSLLRRFDIPVEHLDFSYVEKCSDVREIERILRILKSGEEGNYPDLTNYVENRLKELQPNSRVLRVELPVIKSDALPKETLEEIHNELSEWLEGIEEVRGQAVKVDKNIFDAGDPGTESVNAPVPIRGETSNYDKEASGFVKKVNTDRIKSWEYDKWDKLDVEAELTKMDVTQMQISEWEKYQKPKLSKEQKNTEKLMKNIDNCIQVKPQTKADDKPRISVDKPSFIEEIPSDLKMEDKASKNIKPRRRINIQIEDVHMGF